MPDPVMAALLQTGGLSIQELFTRVGTQFSNRLRVASLLKNGEVRLESLPKPRTHEIDSLVTLDSSEEQIAKTLEDLIGTDDAAGQIEVVPTVKAWRSSST